MSAASQTKIFGMKLGVDPKILVIGLLVVAGVLFWVNSRGGDETHPSSSPTAGTRPNEAASNVEEPPAAASARTRNARDRRLSRNGDHATLKVKAVAPGSGEVDPLLRLDLLEKLANVEQPEQLRNLFQIEAPPPTPQVIAQQQAAKLAAAHPVPVPVAPPMPVVPAAPQANVPFRYYGYAKPSRPGDVNRGFFMNGDDVLVAAEGQILKGSFRIMQLSPQNAVVQDLRVNLNQTLPVTPEAMDQGSNAAFRQGGQGMMQQPNGGMQGPPGGGEGPDQ